MTESLTATWFRAISRAEGVSLLLLFGFAMPLKYAFGEPAAVHWVGWIHGILFLVYGIALGSAARVGSWPWMRVAIGLIAKQIVIIGSHSLVRWDEFLYKYRFFNPLTFILERIFVTPAFHYAHHG